MLNKSINVDYLKDFDFEKNDMKFDCIIMNPPYSRNLHLKILAEAIKHLKDEKSVCVNLSPVRWLQDPLAKHKKNCDLKRFEESVAKHIESIDFIDRFKMTEMFQNCNCDSGVYVCSSSETSFDFSHFHQSELLVRFADLDFTKMDAVLENDQLDGIRVRCGRYGLANDGGTTRANANSIKLGKFEYVHFALSRIYKDGYSVDNGKFWSEDRMPGAGNKAKPIGTPIPSSVRFATIEEARNFVKYTKTNFIRTLKFSAVDVEADADFIVPWLGEVINPRTGLKGYTGEWTDDDLALYFNITPEEQKVIEETMKEVCSHEV